MKISFLGNFTVDYTTENHYKKTLESMGHVVIPLQESKTTSEEVSNIALQTDIFIWSKTHTWHTPGAITMGEVLKRLRAKGIPSVAYHLDFFMGIPERWNYYKNHDYLNVEYFFTPDIQMAQWINAHKNRGYYLQAGVLEEECVLLDKLPPKKHDIIFVGSKQYHSAWPYREKLINWLQETYRDRFGLYGNDGIKVVRGLELNALYQSTPVVVGDSFSPNFDYPYFISDRAFETLGRDGFLIHPLVKGMQDTFTSGKHLRFYEYDNFKQLKYFIDYYLENKQEREEIRLQGHQYVKENHSYRKRWERILEIIK